MIQFAREYDIETGKPKWSTTLPKKDHWQFDFGLGRYREFLFVELGPIGFTFQIAR